MIPQVVNQARRFWEKINGGESQIQRVPLIRPDLHTIWGWERSQLPRFVQESKSAMKYLELLGPLAWDNFPEREERRAWPGPTPVPKAAFVASYLVKIDKEMSSMPKLYEYLKENPAIVWLFGFRLAPSEGYSWGFDVDESLCSLKHFNRVLRELDNEKLQFLLNGTVHLLQNELSGVKLPTGEWFDREQFGESISLDTKHILAWVVENNQNTYVTERYNKEKQLKGDPDCKLGCKEKRNQKQKSHDGSDKTPKQEGMSGSSVDLGTFYWGYKTGVVATKVPFWGEFVLAERTATFNEGDTRFFKPLMAQTENVLGQAPRNGAYDAAFDAYYVYEYHYHAGGTAFVPLRSQHHLHDFTDEGIPLCDAELPFHLKSTFHKKSRTLHPHIRERYVCPLLHPEQTADACPIAHSKWEKGGCTLQIPASIGTRIRNQIDREGAEFKQEYKQRTATERINSLAKNLGIERPKLRNRRSITNQNTLIYITLNLRALQRVQHQKRLLADGVISMSD